MAAYALALGANNLQIGILAALPLLTQVMQLLVETEVKGLAQGLKERIYLCLARLFPRIRIEFRHVIFTFGFPLAAQLLYTTLCVNREFRDVHSQSVGYSADLPHFFFEPIRVVDVLKEPDSRTLKKVPER